MVNDLPINSEAQEACEGINFIFFDHFASNGGLR